MTDDDDAFADPVQQPALGQYFLNSEMEQLTRAKTVA